MPCSPLKNATRLHYDPHELKRFERIECEWPLFFCYLILDGLFHENEDQVRTSCDRTSVDLLPMSRLTSIAIY